MKINKAYSSGDNGGMQELLGYIKNYILTKLTAKQNTLTFDDNPTQNSANPVKSGGVWSGLQSKANDSEVVHKTTNESINGTKTFNSGIVAKANGVCTNTIATDPDSPDTVIDIDASLNVTGKLQMADGNSKGYAELDIGSSSAEFKLKKSPTDTVTPVDIKAENLSQYMGTSQTPYVMQMGTHGVKTDNVKISSDGNIEVSGTIKDGTGKALSSGGNLVPLEVELGTQYTIDDPSEIEAIIVSCIYDNNGSKFIMPAAYLNMNKISIGDTYFFEYDMDNTNIRASIGCSFYMNNSGKLQIYINDLSGYTTVSVGCFSKNNTYAALVADEIDNILDTNY